MNAPTRYILKTSTPVRLASGPTFYLRPIPGEVWLARLGRIPGAYMNTVAAQSSQARKAEAEAFVRDNPDFGVKLATVLLSSVVAVEHDGEAEPMTIVEKPQAECGARELSVSMLTPGDIEEITQAALHLNGMSTEAAEEHRPFFRGEGLALFFGLLGATLRAEPSAPAQDALDGDRQAGSDSDGGARSAGEAN